MIPITHEIVVFFHCSLCIETLPAGKSLRDWSRLEVGFTPLGLQVWCKRHEINVMHIDFQGHKHPVAVTRDAQVFTPQLGGKFDGRN
jgi:hypothetical protein